MRIEKNKFILIQLFLWILLVTFGMILCASAVAQEEVAYDSNNKRDPFVPLVTGIGSQASGLYGIEQIDEIALEGVVYDPRGSVAVVNGLVLQEGDEMGNVKVIKIESDGVLFSLNGTETFKSLYQEETKSQSYD